MKYLFRLAIVGVAVSMIIKDPYSITSLFLAGAIGFWLCTLLVEIYMDRQ